MTSLTNDDTFSHIDTEPAKHTVHTQTDCNGPQVVAAMRWKR